MAKTVRLKLDPEKEIEVGDAEHVDLQRWGLIVEDAKDAEPSEDPQTPEIAPEPAPKPVKGTVKTQEG